MEREKRSLSCDPTRSLRFSIVIAGLDPATYSHFREAMNPTEATAPSNN
ncbi:hypothetical protein HDIA_4490 [Hartmannibacter diazotrophicus]|uniref:Uncharacterized protein n=1 Tax=Hartmannibacter diazotrophicus TaxID=1482074 RepID=A0A2C9DE23_9HYPH|nr:hypothetical protein HDIA_4490 [Hartmannibacter diazotrophicus]